MQRGLFRRIRQIVVKFCAALVVSGTVVLASHSSLALGLRYFAAVSLLVSLGLVGMAVFQRNATEGALSNWHQALIFSVIAAIAHFFAERMA